MSNTVYPERIHGLTFTVTKTPSFNTTKSVASSSASVRVKNYVNPIWKWQLIYEYLYDDFNSPNNTLPYGYSDFKTLIGFFMARSGQFDDFLFNDPSDNTVTQQSMPLITDGTYWYTPLQRTMGGQFAEDITDLQSWTGVYLNGTLISDSGQFQLKGPGLSIPGYSYRGLYLQWYAWQPGWSYKLGDVIIDPSGDLQTVTTAGTSGSIEPTWNDSGSGGFTPDGSGTLEWQNGDTASATATFQFYFRVQFATDDQDFEQFMQELWTVGGEGGKNGKGSIDLITSRLPLNASAGPQAVFTFPESLNPPEGYAAITLFPFASTPDKFTSPIILAGTRFTYGSESAMADGSSESMMLVRGPDSLSDGRTTASASVANYRLPSFISPSQVLAAFAVTYGTKTDGEAVDDNSNPFSDAQVYPAAGFYISTLGTMPPNGESASPFSSFIAAAATYQLAPISPIYPPAVNAGFYAADDNFYGAMGFSAELLQTINGYLTSTFSGGMVIVVWYKP